MFRIFAYGLVACLIGWTFRQDFAMAIQTAATPETELVQQLRVSLRLKSGEIVEDSTGEIVEIKLSDFHLTSQSFTAIATLQNLKRLKISGCRFPTPSMLHQLSHCSKLEELSLRFVSQELPREAWEELIKIKTLRTLRIDSFREANLGGVPSSLPISELICTGIGKLQTDEFQAVSRIETLKKVRLSAYEFSFADCGVFDADKFVRVTIQKLSAGEYSDIGK